MIVRITGLARCSFMDNTDRILSHLADNAIRALTNILTTLISWIIQMITKFTATRLLLTTAEATLVVSIHLVTRFTTFAKCRGYEWKILPRNFENVKYVLRIKQLKCLNFQVIILENRTVSFKYFSPSALLRPSRTCLTFWQKGDF